MHDQTLQCVVDISAPVSDVTWRQHLLSADRRHLSYPATDSTPTDVDVSVAGPTGWNFVPRTICSTRTLAWTTFRRCQKTFSF